MRKPKLAFISCRTYTRGSGLITMPFAFNLLLKLQQRWKVHLFLGEELNPEYAPHLASDVTIRYLDNALGRRFPLKDLQLAATTLGVGYDIVIGVGQVGAHLAHRLARINSCPLILFNDEFPSAFGRSRWTRREALAYQDADLIVVPDIQRIPTLISEIPGIAGKRFIESLNVPLHAAEYSRDIDWHDRVGMRRDSIPLICAGGMADYNQIPELLVSVRSWPENYALVLRGNSPMNGLAYKATLTHLLMPGRTYWYVDPLSTSEFDSLLSYCRISFALYRGGSANLVEVGKSSGKLLRSVALGVPVIASRLSSLSFVEQSGIGVLVSHPAEIADAIAEIEGNGDEYRSRCAEYSRDELCPETSWQQFERAVHDLV